MSQTYKNTVQFPVVVKNNKISAFEFSRNSQGLFEKSLRVTLAIGQIFSLLPVSGIFCTRRKVIFTWRSWKCVYILLSLVGQLFMTVMCVYRVLYSETTLNGKTPIIFYLTTCITMVIFMKVAHGWPALVQHITKSEELNQSYDPRLSYKCNTTCAVILGLSILEYVLSLQSSLAGLKICRTDISYEEFIKYIYPWIFNFIPYSPFLGVIIQLLHLQSTFVYNFSDLFVICMSYYLSSRLECVNKKLLAAKGKYFLESFWRTSREEFGRVVQLVREVDDVISGIIFVCFANNLFFICLQLFNTLDGGITDSPKCNGPLIQSAFYFVFSLLYLLARSVAMSLIVSNVNTTSTVPAIVLYDVPSPVYCLEVQRFLDQVNGEKVALTGLKFFSVTRGLLLTVAGTIVTYELVMLQFNSP